MIYNGSDISIQDSIMTGCLPGSASRNQTCTKELAGFATTKAVTSFPVGKRGQLTFVKLVKASVKAMKDERRNQTKK
jgi:hypothetical protein